MKYAQRCKACKKIFVLQKRAVSCPSCDAPMPPQKPKVTSGYDRREFVNTDENSPPLTWENWRKLEPEKPATKPQEPVSQKDRTNPSDVIAEFLEINEEIASLYSLLYGFMSKNTELIKASNIPGGTSTGMSYGELCDFGFFCREAENTLDELRKEVKARKELCGQVIAMRKTQESLSDPNIKLKVAGQYATGSPDVKMQAQLPKKFTDDYYKITDFLNVPREVAATGVLRLDWKATGDFITQLAADGHKPPDGFGKQYPTYVTTFRRRRQAK